MVNNGIGNATDHDVHYSEDGVKTFTLVTYPVLLLASCIANVLCLVGIIRMTRCHRVFVLSCNLWFMNVVATLTIIPLKIVSVLWMTTRDSCKWYSLVDVSWEVVTLATLTIMAAERFSKVRFRITRKLSCTGRIYEKHWLVVVMWGGAVALAVLVGLVGEREEFADGLYCGKHRIMPEGYTYAHMFLLVILPFFIVTILDLLYIKLTFRHARTVDIYGTDQQPRSHDLVTHVQSGYSVFRLFQCYLAVWSPMIIATLLDVKARSRSDNVVSHDAKKTRNWILHILELLKYSTLVLGPMVFIFGSNGSIMRALKKASIETANGRSRGRYDHDADGLFTDQHSTTYRHDITYTRPSLQNEHQRETVEVEVFFKTKTRLSKKGNDKNEKQLHTPAIILEEIKSPALDKM